MLFRRSLLQELTTSAVGAFLILFGIMIAQRAGLLVKQAASGDIPNDAIAVILGFTMIRFLPMLLSVSIFLAILMTLSRWYRDSEMIIWLSSGQSHKKLLRPIFTFATPIVIVIMVLSLFITPWSNQKVEEYRDQLKSRDVYATITPGVFKEFADGEKLVFIEGFDNLGKQVKNIFFKSIKHQKVGITVAAEGSRLTVENGDNFIVMKNGRRYEGKQDTPEYSITEFDEYAIRIEPKEVISRPPKSESKDSLDLLKNKTNENIAELEWRFAMPIAALILALFAIPLSALDPRGGKSANFILAIIIYIIYNNLLSIVQSWIAQGTIHPLIGLWPVHILFLGLALYLFTRGLNQQPLFPNPMTLLTRKANKRAAKSMTQKKKKYEDSF